MNQLSSVNRLPSSNDYFPIQKVLFRNPGGFGGN
jgi:hypothetical protein